MPKTSRPGIDNQRKDIFVSVIIAPSREFSGLDQYCRNLTDRLTKSYTNYEVIIVDNGLNIDEATKVVSMLDVLPCLRFIRLSRVYTHDISIMAGLEASIGDYTVITDPALDSTEDIIKIVALNENSDIVQGVADISTQKILSGSTIGRKIFYWYNRRYILIDVPIQATYFISLNRRAVRAITISNRHDSHIRHMIKTIGYSYEEYRYKTLTNPIKSHSIATGTVEALDIITSHSVHPLRLMSWIGLFASIVNIFYALYVVIVALTRSDLAAGWVSLSLELSVMFFMIFLFMVVLSEYVGKILIETRRDARYHVLDEISSTVSLADAERKNITS